jgi:hypothetical protein
MKHLLEVIEFLSMDDEFCRFQNGLSNDLYTALSSGCATAANEVELVKRIVDTVDGRFYKTMKLHGTMLHGPKSFVEFCSAGSMTTKELGDMAVVQLVTNGTARLFQRICIIQNKKSNGSSWSIDPEQIFLLKNFPPFSATKGIFRGASGVTFRNSSGGLGAFGLLDCPAEMTWITAPLLSEVLIGRKSVNLKDLRTISGLNTLANTPIPYHFFHPFLLGASSALGSGGHGFLGIARYLRDLFDFVRSWTQMNIGETTFADGKVQNQTVDSFTKSLLFTAGFGELADFGSTPPLEQMEPEFEIALLFLHLDISGFPRSE